MAISKAHPDFTSFVKRRPDQRACRRHVGCHLQPLARRRHGGAAHTSPARRLLPGSVMTETSLADLEPPHRGTGRHPGAHAGEPG